MALPPLLARELHLRAKLAKTSWIRVGVVGFALFGWLLPIVVGTAPVTSGRFSLLTLSFCPMLLSILCGIGVTAESISREKREGTLVLLLLTRVTPLEILLQKIVSSSAPFLSGLLAVLPLCALPLILGGVSGTDLIVVMTLVGSTAVLSLSLGCFISCCVWSINAAVGGTFLAVLAFFATPWLLGVAYPRSSFAEWLAMMNPVYAYASLFRAGAATVSIGQAMGILFGTVILSAGFISFGALFFPRTYSRRFSTLRARAEELFTVSGASLFLALAVLLPDERLLLSSALISANLLKLTVLLAAVRVLGNRSWLETLLTTPLDPFTYLLSEAKTLARKLMPLWAITLCAEGIILVRLPARFRDIAAVLVFFVIGDCVALALTGLWNGLKCRCASHAVSLSVTSVVLVPFCIALLAVAFGFRTETLAGALLLWALLALSVDILAAANARWMLAHRLRSVASTMPVGNFWD